MSSLISMYRKLFNLAEQDQPIQAWYVAVSKVFLVEDKIWAARTMVLETTAKETKYVNKIMPRGCNKDNPWVYVVLMGDVSAVVEMNSKDFLEMVKEIHIFSNEEFFAKYKEFLNREVDSMKRFEGSLTRVNESLKSFLS